MAIDLYGDGCLWEELENDAGGEVKGYRLVYETDAARIQREAEQLAAQEDQAAREAAAELERQRQEVLNDIADSYLGSGA